MFNALIDRFQAKFPPNRLVALAMALLIPTAITPAAAYVATWVPAHFPGLPAFTPAQLTAFAITGGLAALTAGVTAGYKYIDGWQDHEERTFFGKPEPGEDSDRVEIAKIEAEAAKIVALVNAGHLPESMLELVHGEAPVPGPAAANAIMASEIKAESSTSPPLTPPVPPTTPAS